MTTTTVPAEWQDVAAELQQVFVEGEQALTIHRQGLPRVFSIGHAFAAMQQEAMHRSHSNNPIGKRYNEAFERLSHPTRQMTKVNKTDRSQYVWCYEHRAQLEEWWPTLADNQRDRWGHPDTIKKQYLKVHADELPAKAQGEAKQLSPAAKMSAEIIRLQEEVDAKERELRQLKRGADNVSEGRDWTWTDPAEAIATAWLSLYPTKAPQVASKVLEMSKSTAKRVRRGVRS